jgi:uncharacterized membrane protein (UPF0127 family)
VRRRLIIGLLIALGLAMVTWFLVQGANRPADPYFRSAIPGFAEQSFSIEAKGEPGSGSLRCALVAATDAHLSRGLMGRRDLGGYDGMIFRFATEGLRPFTMRGTLIPLSIAWFDADGILVDQAEMTPCPERVSCPDYSSDKPYQYALETERGGLRELGVAPGAHLALGGTCS